jgi:hypothetical protein
MKKDRDSASAGKPPQGDASAAAPAGRWASLVPWLALPIGIALALLFARRPDVAGLMHDDGVYLSMAREISAGHGPVDGHVPAPVRTARFPPLHPLVLALESALLGVPAQGLANVHRLIAFNAVWVALALGLFLRWLIVRRGWPPALALAAGLATFALPQVLGHAQQLMSEPLFTALLLAAVVRLDGVGGDPAGATPRALAATGLLCGLLPATRSAGAALAFAAAAYVVAVTRTVEPARRTRARLAFAAGVVVPWIAAALWSTISVHADPELARSGLLGPPYSALLPKGSGELLQVVSLNVVRFADCFLKVVLPRLPAADETGAGPFALRVATIVALASLSGIAFRTRRRRPATSVAWLLCGYGLLLLPWPFADTRFLVPVAPLAIAWIGEGAAAPFARVVRRWPRLAGVATFVALAAWNAPETGALFREEGGTASRFGVAVPLAPIEQAADWLARSTAPGDVFAATLDPTLHFLSGRPGVSSWRNDQPLLEAYAGGTEGWRQLFTGGATQATFDRCFAGADSVVAEYERLGVKHVVVLRMGGHPLHDPLARHLIRGKTPAAERFTRVFVSSDGLAEIYRFEPARR